MLVGHGLSFVPLQTGIPNVSQETKNVFSNLLFLLPGSESLEMVVEYVWQFWAFNRSCVAQLPFGNEHSPILISQLPGLEYCIPVSP